MRVCVVGERGYIGSNLVPYLREKGHEVSDHFKDEIECIINCAQHGAKPGQDNIKRMVYSNTQLPMYMLDFGYKKMIHLSSSSEIFQPHTAYARTKSLASDYLRGKATLCYLYTVWGGINQHPHTFMAALLKAKREGTQFNLSTPFATRDFVHIKHICRGIEELIHKPIGEYHFGTGKERMMYSISASLSSVPDNWAGAPMGKEWKASNPYFPDTFEEDLKEELCK